MSLLASIRGFTRLELAAIVLVCGLFIVPLFVSAMTRAKERSQRITCTHNLKELCLALKTWALEHGDRFPMNVPAEEGGSTQHAGKGEVFRYFQMMSASPKTLVCPSDVRKPATNLESGLSNINLSYFLGLDAVDTNPQMFLSGDRNLTNGPLPSNRILVLSTNFDIGWTYEMHHNQGNIGLADGSVQQFSRKGLSESLRSTAFNNTGLTNRLAMP